MRTYHAESARIGLEAVAAAGLSWRDFSLAAIELLKRAVPFDAICVGLSDPATRLLTSDVQLELEDLDSLEFIHHEYEIPDFNKYADLARREVAVGILDEATGGDPARSVRQSGYLRSAGISHELRCVVRHNSTMWGTYTLYRTTGRTGFSPAEAHFMHRMERTLALGVRRGLLATETERAGRDTAGTAVIIFDDSNTVVFATPSAEERVRQLGGDLWTALPLYVGTVVSSARAALVGQSNLVPEMRVRTRAGEWLTLQAAPVRDQYGATGKTAVTIAPAAADKVIPLIVAAYGLTERERQVVQRVLLGESTTQIAATLWLSPYTVQDHLKAVFDKVGVSSRRELGSRIFFSQYATRLGTDVDSTGWFTG